MFVGRTEGRVVPARGGGSFGWDPIFLPDGFDTTFAEMDKQLKNTISHRHALRVFPAFWTDSLQSYDTHRCSCLCLLYVKWAQQVEHNWEKQQYISMPQPMQCRYKACAGCRRYRALDQLRDYLLHMPPPEASA